MSSLQTMEPSEPSPSHLGKAPTSAMCVHCYTLAWSRWHPSGEHLVQKGKHLGTDLTTPSRPD